MLTINGVDPKTYGFKLAAAPAWLDGPPVRVPRANRPLRPGSIILAASQEAERRLSLRGYVEGATAAAARANLDKLQALLHAPSLAIAFADRPGVTITGYLDGAVQVPPGPASQLATTLDLSCEIVCPDPFFYSDAQTSIAFGAAGNFCPQGTAPVRPVLSLFPAGNNANPTFTLYNSAGAALASLALTVSMVNGDTLVVDMAACTVRKNGVLAMQTITGGDFFGFDVASQGNYAASAWPKVGVVHGTVTAYSSTCVYRRAWR
jgi:hypothetical protein